jgi:hypothetical protein
MEGSLLQLHRKSWQSGHRCLEDGQVHSDSDEVRGNRTDSGHSV